jgi:hypothetical protein
VQALGSTPCKVVAVCLIVCMSCCDRQYILIASLCDIMVLLVGEFINRIFRRLVYSLNCNFLVRNELLFLPLA